MLRLDLKNKKLLVVSDSSVWPIEQAARLRSAIRKALVGVPSESMNRFICRLVNKLCPFFPLSLRIRFWIYLQGPEWHWDTNAAFRSIYSAKTLLNMSRTRCSSSSAPRPHLHTRTRSSRCLSARRTSDYNPRSSWKWSLRRSVNTFWRRNHKSGFSVGILFMLAGCHSTPSQSALYFWIC